MTDAEVQNAVQEFFKSQEQMWYYWGLEKLKKMKEANFLGNFTFNAGCTSHKGNPRQGESENVDGNTCLALDFLV